MALSGQQNINIGAENSPSGSDPLNIAFKKIQENFDVLFSNTSPYTNFVGSIGLSTSVTGNKVQLINTGVTQLNAGSGIAISSANGNVTISLTQSSNTLPSGVTRVGAISNTLAVLSTPIISTGNIILELPETGIVAGQYIRPTLTVDAYGRITEIESGPSQSGTVTSVEVEGLEGIEVTNSVVTSAGTIQIKNTGVTQLTAGVGISLSSPNGEVTVGMSEDVLSKIDQSPFADLNGQIGDILVNDGNGAVSWKSPFPSPIFFGNSIPTSEQYPIGTLFYIFSGISQGLYISNGTQFLAISSGTGTPELIPVDPPIGFINPVVENFLLETTVGEKIVLSLGAPLEVIEAELTVSSGSVIEVFD